MAATTIPLLLGIVGLSAHILLCHKSYSEFVLQAAVGALLVDVLGLIVAVYKIALNPGLNTNLAPVTSSSPLEVPGVTKREGNAAGGIEEL
jgi:hypothetical protein